MPLLIITEGGRGFCRGRETNVLQDLKRLVKNQEQEQCAGMGF